MGGGRSSARQSRQLGRKESKSALTRKPMPPSHGAPSTGNSPHLSAVHESRIAAAVAADHPAGKARFDSSPLGALPHKPKGSRSMLASQAPSGEFAPTRPPGGAASGSKRGLKPGRAGASGRKIKSGQLSTEGTAGTITTGPDAKLHAHYARLAAANEASGRPSDEATELLDAAAQKIDLLSELRGRIATSYNSVHVESQVRRLKPATVAMVRDARKALYARANTQVNDTQKPKP